MSTNTNNLLLRQGLKKMVIEECNVKNITTDRISDEEPIIGGSKSLRLDSLDAVEIVSALERNFGIRLDNAGEARHIYKSFAVMSEFVEKNALPASIEGFLKRYS